MGILAVLQLITQVAVESQVATGAIFGLIKGVRDGWSSPGPDENRGWCQ